MRAVLQRVRRASVVVGSEQVGQIDHGLLILLGIHRTDSPEQARSLADKAAGLRIFEDEAGKMNVSVHDAGGSILVVSQFTLYGDCQKGRRPSFIEAAPPELAEPLYEQFADNLRALGIRVETGRFGADMQVELVNDGPVTVVIET
jgi:D-aminoacyl-tRNA deacylase